MISSLSLVALMVTIGCGSNEVAKTEIAKVATQLATPSITEESLGLRKTNLYVEKADTVGDMAKYSKDVTGASTKIARAFENAPPMIPHDIEGMLPIKINSNECLTCHLPANAKAMKESMPNLTEIPASHFASFRPVTAIGADGKITKEGKSVDNTSDLLTVSHKLDKLSNSRFSCSQCHAPQSNVKPLVENTFTPDFSKDGIGSSNLMDTINDGVEIE